MANLIIAMKDIFPDALCTIVNEYADDTSESLYSNQTFHLMRDPHFWAKHYDELVIMVPNAKIKLGHNVHITVDNKITQHNFFHFCSRKKAIGNARITLSDPSNFDLTDNLYAIALYSAAFFGFVDLCAKILKHTNFDCRMCWNGTLETPLTLAIKNHHLSVVMLFLQRAKAAYKLDELMSTRPLEVAMRAGAFDIFLEISKFATSSLAKFDAPSQYCVQNQIKNESSQQKQKLVMLVEHQGKTLLMAHVNGEWHIHKKLKVQKT
jgi:hypothetical protein